MNTNTTHETRTPHAIAVSNIYRQKRQCGIEEKIKNRSLKNESPLSS